MFAVHLLLVLGLTAVAFCQDISLGPIGLYLYRLNVVIFAIFWDRH